MFRHKETLAQLVRCIFCLFALIVVFSSTSQTQDEKTVDRSPQLLKVPVDLVVVPVTVKDSDGNMVAGLEKSDFLLEDDGIPQPISYFSIDPLPLSVAILVDRTLDDRTQELFQKHLGAILGGLSSFDEAALFDFMGVRHKLQDFTMDREIISKAAAGIRFLPGYTMPILNAPTLIPGGQGPSRPSKTAEGIPEEAFNIKLAGGGPECPDLGSAIYSVAHDMHKRENWRRRVIFVVSSGRTALADRGIIPETLQYLSKEGIVVCGISGGSTILFRHLDPLQKYATATGGEVFLPVRDQAFPKSFQRLLVDARNQYVLGFKPQELGRASGFRKIKVVAVNPRCQGGEIHYRHGYYARPISSDSKPNKELPQ